MAILSEQSLDIWFYFSQNGPLDISQKVWVDIIEHF